MAEVTKEAQYLELLVNAEEPLSQKEVMETLDISPSTAWRYAKKLKDKIAEAAKDYARSLALEMVNNLRKNANNGDTGAAVKILEVGEVYIPRQKSTIDGIPVTGVIVLPERVMVDQVSGESDEKYLDPAKEVKPTDE